jgi:nucleoside-diphosphate-sugar epimerase
MSKIVITGGGGYIGSILVPKLLRSGHDVTVVDNFMYRQTSLLDVCNDPQLTVINGDARSTELIKKQLENADFFIPLACLVGAPACDRDPTAGYSINYEAIKHVLDYYRYSKNLRVIFPTTNSGYGIGQEGIYCTEETPLNPISNYGIWKVEIEKHILNTPGVEAITLRLATVFGVSPRMRMDLLVNDFVNRAVKDRFIILFEAHFKRNYIHIRDVAKAFIHCIDNFDTMKNQPYNVGLSDANISKWELCEEIQKQIPSFYFVEAKIGKDPDQRNYIVSNEKIEKTGYKPDFSLQDGITELRKGLEVLQRKEYTNA